MNVKSTKEMVRTTVWIEKETHRKLKILSAQNGTSISEQIRRMYNLLLQENNKRGK